MNPVRNHSATIKKKDVSNGVNYPRVIIAATHSGVGKTTLTLGIMLALRKRGLAVQPFKAGPDYIDPTYHTLACINICRNLDSWLLKPEAILELFEKEAKKADVSVIEGVMGLYDGIRDNERGSTAHLSKILTSPVILIINAASLSRSAAAIALGYKEFDRQVNIAGIILNNIGSPSHYCQAKTAIEKKTRIPVIGFLPKNPDLKLPQRHLGLVPAPEKRLTKSFQRKLLKLVEENIDIEGILRISRKAKAPPGARKNIFVRKSTGGSCPRIAIARDEAFNFYYQDNLDILKYLGAKLVEFSPLKDKKLPQGAQGLYIGGGFPELFASGLSRNAGLKDAIYQYANEGLPVYAECAGLMYLVKGLVDFQGKNFPMVGIFGCLAVMGRKFQALGYIEIEVIRNNILSNIRDKIRAHTFHWSYLENLPKNVSFAYKVKKNNAPIYYDGLIWENVLAGYAHLHFAANISFARNFIRSCVKYGRVR